MDKRLNYFDFAEDDYLFYLENYKENRVGNTMCSGAQGICEKYLKHLIDSFCKSVDTTSVLRTHSLRVLKKFLSMNLEDYSCDWNTVLGADGFYFSARYPGDDAFLVDRDDVEVCWKAVEEVRKTVIMYCNEHPAKSEPVKFVPMQSTPAANIAD